MLKFEAPDISPAAQQGTPIAIANKSFPYYEIADDRRFEHLVYSIYKIKIDNNAFLPFDGISIMTGVRDLGRDCVLYKSNKPYGVIQCKKYSNPYSKNELGLEIVKFMLYSMLDERIVHDYSDFTYYICTAKGLAADCIDFVTDFNTVVVNDPNLEKWINKCLDKPTLESLNINLDYELFKDFLSKITVKNISPQDLDIELSSPILSQIASLFFEVRTVTDNTKLEELKHLIKPPITKQQIIDSFQISSVSLHAEKNEFSSLTNSNIQRKETNDLYNWIITDNIKQEEHNNISLLVGAAGYGKTVVLKDLYDKCIQNDIAILGLKADKLYPQSLEDLQKSIDAPLPLIEFIQESKKHFTKIIILIDQIDALSQSMSSDRRFLNVFRSFIDNFSKDANVRIILSVRPYELNYDPSLKFYKNAKSFQLKPLSEKEVIQILKKAEINPDILSPKLLELLRIPNQLDVFLQIATDGTNRIQSISIHGLYLELWRQKVIELTQRTSKFQDSLSVKKLLYTIAKHMFDVQRISVSVLKYEDQHHELSYLESERLIKKEGKQIQFFHQSFYDFIFSKQLVENETDIIQYIKDEEQSIHIRSAVRMIFSYLRDYDPHQYIYYIQSLLDDSNILFHIKHVVFSLIVSFDRPTTDEIKLIKGVIKNDIHLELLFLEMAKGEVWFGVALDTGTLQIVKTILPDSSEDIVKYKQHVAFSFIQNQLTSYNLGEAWEFLATVPHKKSIQNILYSITDWSNPISYQLFESCEDFEEDDMSGYYHVIDNIAKQNEDYAISILTISLRKTSDKTKNSTDAYQEKEILKTLAVKCPQKIYPILLKCVISVIGQDNRYNHGLLIKDWVFHDVDLPYNDDNLGDDGFLYKLLAISLKRIALGDPFAYSVFFDGYKNSKYESILRLVLYSLQDNEQSYSNQIFELFKILTQSKIIEEDHGLEHELRTLIEKTLCYFTTTQTKHIINYIKTYKRLDEISHHTYGEPLKKHFHSNWGRGKYFWLKRLPKNLIKSDIELFKAMNELKRRHGDRTDKAKVRRPSVLIGCHSPIDSRAYQYMSKEQWISAFRKYDANREREFRSSRGGMHELASGFRDSILENPSNEKLEILKAIINDISIDITYVFHGIQAFAEKRKDIREVLTDLLKTAIARKEHKDLYYPVQIASKLIGHEIENPYLFAFLLIVSTDFNEKDYWIAEESNEKTSPTNGLVFSGLNKNYGVAIEAITHVKDPNYQDSVFDTIENILSSGPEDARAIIYSRLAYLMHLDIKKTNEIFAQYIAKEENIYVIASSLWSLQYLRKNGFGIIGSAYEKLIESNILGRDDAHSLFIILYGSYLYDIEGAKELLYQFIKRHKQFTIRGVSEILKNYYILPDSKGKNDDLLYYILREIHIDEEDDFTINFLHIDHINLTDIYPFLSGYIRSPLFVISEHFINYLSHQSTYEPLKAIELFDLAFDRHKGSFINKRLYRLDEAFIKFIVGAYDSLTSKNEEYVVYRGKLLQRFDHVLQDFRLRRSADKILEKLT